MKLIVALFLIAMAGILTHGHAADLRITSFGPDGELTWSNSRAGLHYDVEWVSAIGDRWDIAPAPYWDMAVTGWVGSVTLPLAEIDEQRIFFRLRSYTSSPPPELRSGQVVRHSATNGNPYAFYTYFPRRAEARDNVSLCVWPHGGGASSTDYSYHEAMASNQINRLSEFSDRYRVPILVAAIPRVNEIYVHSLHPDTFTTTDDFLYRPDLKLIDAVWNQYIPFLEDFGCRVSHKVLMMGYSSPGMFTHRFAMFHPDLVKAVWLGGEAPAPVCAGEMHGTKLEYPVGTYNWESLVGEPFQHNTYIGIPHLVTVGGNDTNANNDTTTYTDIFTESQRLFIRSHFGDTNPERIKFYADHLSATNVPTTFRQYDGVGHNLTDEMLEDAFKFLTNTQ